VIHVRLIVVLLVFETKSQNCYCKLPSLCLQQKDEVTSLLVMVVWLNTRHGSLGEIVYSDLLASLGW
jgi:hypothetical protein